MDDKRGDGATPLIVHTELGSLEVVRVLIELNANVDLQDEVGMSVSVCKGLRLYTLGAKV